MKTIIFTAAMIFAIPSVACDISDEDVSIIKSVSRESVKELNKIKIVKEDDKIQICRLNEEDVSIIKSVRPLDKK